MPLITKLYWHSIPSAERKEIKRPWMLPENGKWGNFHSSFYETSITLKTKLDKDITKKRKLETKFTHENELKIF